jgi:hypothetical protein
MLTNLGAFTNKLSKSDLIPRFAQEKRNRSGFNHRSGKIVLGLLSLVEVNGFEPMTSCVQGRRSPS